MKKNDKKFLYFAFFLTMAIFLAIQLFGRVYLTPLDDIEIKTVEVTPALRLDVRESFESMTGLELAEKLAAAKDSGKSVFLKFYASWCPHCRKTVPYFVHLKQEGYFENTEVIFLAVDKKPEELAEYLAAHEYHKEFTPYIYRPEFEGDLRGVIEQYDLGFKGSIPYMALIGADGKLVSEALGDDVLAINFAIKSSSPVSNSTAK